MSEARFHYCLKIVLGNEGGLVDDKADRGGRTNFGITQKTLDDFCRATGRTLKPVDQLTDEDVELIYAGYWKDCRADYLPEGLDLCVFDCAVNSGAGRAIKLLQRALGVDEDGVYGKQTSDALREELRIGSIAEVCEQYLKLRADFYGSIVANDIRQKRFINGWLNRLDHLRKYLA